MKLILLLAALAAAWLWRQHRDADQAQQRTARSAAPRPMLQDMVRCGVCAVHVPRPDAVAGRHGAYYCCAEHRRHAED
jgi:uncharacterized protein